MHPQLSWSLSNQDLLGYIYLFIVLGISNYNLFIVLQKLKNAVFGYIEHHE